MARRALSASRAAQLLNLLAAHPDESFSYAQIAQRLQVNLASTHSLLLALTECGYLSRDPTSRTFSLGPALVAIGDAALRGNPAIDEARVQMRRLSSELGIETLAFVRAGGDALCVARAGPRQSPGRTARVGQRIPLIAPLSSVFVAWSPDEEGVAEWIRRAQMSDRAAGRARSLLDRVRQRGYSVALEIEGRRQLGELLDELAEDPRSESLGAEMRNVIRELGRGRFQLVEDGVSTHRVATITAPVFDAHGQVALSLTLPVFRRGLSNDAIGGLGARLLRATGAVTEAAASMIRA